MMAPKATQAMNIIIIHPRKGVNVIILNKMKYINEANTILKGKVDSH